MKKSISITKILIFLVILAGGYQVYDTYYTGDTVKIANWNLQIFGETKANNIPLMDLYVDKIDNYDIIFIQEIRDKSGISFKRLCTRLQNYTCRVSSKAGRTSSKEQYGIIYRDGINLTYYRDYNPDPQDRWERPPIKASFNINGYNLNIYNIHTKPDTVQQELDELEKTVSNAGNTIIIGDLNADCSYYNNQRQTEFDNWNWLIKDDDDTTSSSTHCAYDRIILNSDVSEEYKKHNIDKTQITKDVSDHYIVWVELGVGE